MNRRARFWAGLGIALMLIWTLAPLYWLVTMSLKTEAASHSVPVELIPHHITLENFLQMFQQYSSGSVSYRFFHALRNGLIQALSTVLISLFFGTLAGWVLARYRIPGRNLLNLVFLGSNLLPTIALVMPFYIIVVDYLAPLKLYGTNLLLILMYVSFTLGFAVWIMRGYFESIPVELEEAAIIDGTSKLGALARISLPLAVPGLIATALLVFLLSWDNFLLPLIFAPNPTGYNMTFFIYSLNGQYLHQDNQVAAAGVIASIPPTLIVLLFGRYIVSGLTAGSVKG
jgi:multiple sugar transport system permease protein